MDRSFRTTATLVDRDAGLRRHMLGIYRTMGLGLLLSAATALGVASSPALSAAIFGSPLKWLVMLAPLAFVFFFSFRIEKMTVGGARLAFFAFAAVMGVSLASVFLVFTGTSIARTFLVAAIMFGGMSLWGYTTGRDLSRFSNILMMGLLGVVVASLINVFVGSGVIQLIVSLVAVAVFTGLTAWDTQRAKSEYFAYAGTQQAEKLAIMSALGLYLNLINMFQLLLTFTGQRNE